MAQAGDWSGFIAPGAQFAGSGREAEAIIAGLGAIADQLGTRGAVAQFEADLAVPARTRAGTAFAGTTGPLPRFLPVRDIVRISLNMIDIVPAAGFTQRLSRTTRLPTDDNLVNTMPYAPTLRAAQELSFRYGNAMLPWFRRRLQVAGDEARLVYQPVTALGRIEAISTELSLMSNQRTIETIIGAAATGARLHFGVQPPTDPGVLAERCGCRVTVGDGESHIAIPLAWLAQAGPYHDPALWAEGLTRCEADMAAVRVPLLVARVRAHVAAGLDSRRIVTIAETAQALDMSERSLVRGLSDAGTTHHTIIDDARRDRVRDLLAHSALSMADIAERLAFSDQSSFGRKCQPWFGTSPVRFRHGITGKTDVTA